jgi:hypothetical protein
MSQAPASDDFAKAMSPTTTPMTAAQRVFSSFVDNEKLFILLYQRSPHVIYSDKESLVSGDTFLL